ncbi:MAG: ThuA domain-containing protein [Candidatus Anammoximicrobium sp.]|nr:ThuA domain-containing protein [Candidatus Anammoximicrobium sp.]
MKRRQVLQTLGSAVLGFPFAGRLAAADRKRPDKILFFTRSVLFEHSVVHRQGDELSLAEKALASLARQIDCDVECTKDGRVFDRALDPYAAVVSYTCGRPADLMKPDSRDRSPPLSESGWKNLDAAVREGMPYVAVHPGLWLLPEAGGADCLGHGTQQVARIQVVSPQFPGAEKLGDSFSLLEEWFSLIRFAQDLHVILVQDCAGMNKDAPADRRCYDRPPFPSTWARMHGKGRVFYTSLGHREDVWSNQIFEQILRGGLSWALGRVDADITPNIAQVAPQANAFPKT